jgi:hypothetical protein
MALADGSLLAMLRKLQRLPDQHRSAVLQQLSPAERAQIDRHVQADADPDTLLSPALAELIERLCDGPTSEITPLSRDALLVAATNIKAALPDIAPQRPSLVERLLSKVVGARQ